MTARLRRRGRGLGLVCGSAPLAAVLGGRRAAVRSCTGFLRGVGFLPCASSGAAGARRRPRARRRLGRCGAVRLRARLTRLARALAAAAATAALAARARPRPARAGRPPRSAATALCCLGAAWPRRACRWRRPRRWRRPPAGPCASCAGGAPWPGGSAFCSGRFEANAAASSSTSAPSSVRASLDRARGDRIVRQRRGERGGGDGQLGLPQRGHEQARPHVVLLAARGRQRAQQVADRRARGGGRAVLRLARGARELPGPGQPLRLRAGQRARGDREQQHARALRAVARPGRRGLDQAHHAVDRVDVGAVRRQVGERDAAQRAVLALGRAGREEADAGRLADLRERLGQPRRGRSGATRRAAVSAQNSCSSSGQAVGADGLPVLGDDGAAPGRVVGHGDQPLGVAQHRAAPGGASAAAGAAAWA